jgi:hypothetical protein
MIFRHISVCAVVLVSVCLCSSVSAQPTGYGRDYANSRPDVRVELFVTETSKSCQRLEKFLTEMEIPYIRYDLQRDQAARRAYLADIGHGVIPATRINNGPVIRGDEPAKIYKAILKSRRQIAPANNPAQPGAANDAFEHTPPAAPEPYGGAAAPQTGANAPPQEEFAQP